MNRVFLLVAIALFSIIGYLTWSSIKETEQTSMLNDLIKDQNESLINGSEEYHSKATDESLLKAKIEEERKVQDSLNNNVKNAVAKILKRFTVQKDDFTETTFYTHVDAPVGFNPYIAKATNDVWVRQRVKYSGDDFIGLETLRIKIGSKISDHNLSGYEVKTSVYSGTVSEIIDVVADDYWIGVLYSFSMPGDISIRLQGRDGTKDFKISQKHVMAIEETLTLYNLLKQTQ